VPLTEFSLPTYKSQTDGSGGAYYGHEQGDHAYGLPLRDQKTEYEGAGGERHITIVDDAASRRTGSGGSSLLHPGPTPPPHSARRQFSFQNVFRKGTPQQHQPEEHQPQSRSPMIRKGLGQRKTSHGAQTKGATEEERLGLVKGDTQTGRVPQEPEIVEDYEEDDDSEDWTAEDKLQHRQSPDRGPRRDLTPPRREGKEKELEPERSSDEEQYEQYRRKWGQNGGQGRKHPQGKPPPPPPFDDKGGDGGAFI